jgi:hypothetical protein
MKLVEILPNILANRKMAINIFSSWNPFGVVRDSEDCCYFSGNTFESI